MNQSQFIHDFAKSKKYKFNSKLFDRSDDKIIYFLKCIYKSIERTMGVNSFFTIKVQNFEEVDDYDTIRDILADVQEAAIKKSVKLKNSIDNRYKYIDLKETDMKLLITTLFIEAYDGRETIQSIIAVPRVIDKFYFRINGNVRFAMHQLVDASTYNNQTSNAKSPMNVFKTIFQPIRVYRNNLTFTTVDGEEVNFVSYEADIFKKSVPAAEYIFAKMGLTRGLQFLGLDGIFVIGKYIPANKDAYYTFLPKKSSGIYVSVPKYIFQQNQVVQHVTAVFCMEFIRKFAVMEDIYTRDMWLEALGRHFSLATPRPKAISVLASLDFIYDKITKGITHLPNNDKNDIYNILRWVLYEYDALILKNNLDVSIKRIRIEEYIAGLLAPKISKGIYALSDMGERVNLVSIKKRLNINFDFLITEVAKTSIVVFADTVTDCDSYAALKFSRNGPSSLGEANSSSMPMVYRYIDVSSLGILDSSASSPSSPGTSGLIAPLAPLYDGGYFIDYQEPDTWREDLFKQVERVNKETSLRQVATFKQKILEQSDVPELAITDFKISEETRQHLIETANR